MKVAILALTCDRPAKMQLTWENNMRADLPIYWWDQSGHHRDQVLATAAPYSDHVRVQVLSPTNVGIAKPLNYLAAKAFADGADLVITMADDILEPIGHVEARVQLATELPDIGVVATPPGPVGVARYGRLRTPSGLFYECGDVIGNYGITRTAWDRVCGLAEYYGIYGPIDIDYCHRLRHSGLRAAYVSDFTSTHIDGPDRAGYAEEKKQSLKNAWATFHHKLHEFKRGQSLYHGVDTEDIEAILADSITCKTIPE